MSLNKQYIPDSYKIGIINNSCNKNNSGIKLSHKRCLSALNIDELISIPQKSKVDPTINKPLNSTNNYFHPPIKSSTYLQNISFIKSELYSSLLDINYNDNKNNFESKQQNIINNFKTNENKERILANEFKITLKQTLTEIINKIQSNYNIIRKQRIKDICKNENISTVRFNDYYNNTNYNTTYLQELENSLIFNKYGVIFNKLKEYSIDQDILYKQYLLLKNNNNSHIKIINFMTFVINKEMISIEERRLIKILAKLKKSQENTKSLTYISSTSQVDNSPLCNNPIQLGKSFYNNHISEINKTQSFQNIINKIIN